MSKEDRDRAQARMDKQTRAAQDARSGKADRDQANKAVLDNMAKGYEGDRKSFSEAQSVIGRLDELLTQGKTSGLLKVSVFIPLRRELDLVRQSLEEPPPEF